MNRKIFSIAIILAILISFTSKVMGAANEEVVNKSCNFKFNDGSNFEGVCTETNIPLKGKITTPDGDVMKGEFDGIHGDYFKGSVTYKNLDILLDEGAFEKFLLEGKGKRTYSDGTVFEGYFKNHNPEKGSLIYKNGTKYIGSFVTENALSQFISGEKIYPDGTVEKGAFSNWQLNGAGIRIHPNNKKEIGIFSNGELAINQQQEEVTKDDQHTQPTPQSINQNDIKNSEEAVSDTNYYSNQMVDEQSTTLKNILQYLIWLVLLIFGSFIFVKNQKFKKAEENKKKAFFENYKQIKEIGTFLKNEAYLEKLLPLKIKNKIDKCEVIHSSLKFRYADTNGSADWAFERPYWTKEDDDKYNYAMILYAQEYNRAQAEYQQALHFYEIKYNNWVYAKNAHEQREENIYHSSRVYNDYYKRYDYPYWKKSFSESAPSKPYFHEPREPSRYDYCHYETVKGKCNNVNFKPVPIMISNKTKFKTSQFGEINADFGIEENAIFNIYSKILPRIEKKSLKVVIDKSVKSFNSESEIKTLDRYKSNLNSALEILGKEKAAMNTDDKNFQLINVQYGITSIDYKIPIIILIYNKKNEPKKNEIYICDHIYPELINFKLTKSNFLVSWLDKLFQ